MLENYTSKLAVSNREVGMLLWLTIKPRSGGKCEKKLASIGVGSWVCHGQNACPGML